MPAPEEAQVAASPGTGWIATCAALCAAIVAYGMFGDKDMPDDLARQIGYSFPIAVFLAGALHVAFRKRESTQTSWIGFVLIYASLLTAFVAASNRQKTEIRTVTVDIQQAIAVIQSAVNSEEIPPPPMETNQVSGGGTGETEVVLRTIINRMLAQRREYEIELEAIGWSKILDDQRLRSDVTLAESRTILQQAQEIVEKYKKRTNEMFAQLRQDIVSSDLKPDSKRSMLAGFDKTTEQGKEQSMELWSLEEQALSQIGNAFNLMAARRGAWRIQDGQVTFHRQEDMDLLKTYMSQVQAIVTKQEQIQSASLRRMQESLTQIGK